MTRALEINAATLVLSQDSEPALIVPGAAVAEGDRLLTGAPALARARLAPLFAHLDFWEHVDTEPLLRGTPRARSTADLAYAQLRELPLTTGGAGERLIVCVPASCTQAQLRLLTGIAQAAGVQLAGFVTTAVAACADIASAPRSLHLDLEYSRAVLTELVRDGELARGRVEVQKDAGQRVLHEAIARQIATAFLRTTRFDPLFNAATEQQLFDQLEGWMRAAAAGTIFHAAIDEGGQKIEVEVAPGEFLAAAAPLCAELKRFVQTLRRAGEPVTLFVSARAARVPGLVAELATLKDCQLEVLAEAAAVEGALAHVAEIESDEIGLVQRLRGAPAIELPTSEPVTGEAPTHLVHQGRAIRLTAEPLLLGRQVAARPGTSRALQLDGAATGLSRRHCSLVSRGGEVVLEDLSTYGTFVNGERVRGRARLRAGDRLRLGTPGVTLELIQMADGDGAA
jgi:hypothetical protein